MIDVLDEGPFFHGTKADLAVGGLLTAGFRSNYRPEVVMNHIYFTALRDGAGLAAELAALRRDNDWLTGQVDRERETLGTMREAFQTLASDALSSNRTAFLDSLESRQKAFDGVVLPIAETLNKVDVKLAEAERERLDAYARLTEKVSALGSSADTLSRALRTPTVRGRWGEM